MEQRGENSLSSIRNLNLQGLASGMPGLSPAKGEYCGECASVCLETHNGHQQGTQMSVISHDGGRIYYSISWKPVTLQMAQSCNDAQEATEHGAECVALLLMKDILRYEVVCRSRKGTGIDYMLGNLGSALRNPVARLEVSGILNSPQGVKSRVTEKKKQTLSSQNTQLPAFIVVVEFSQPLAEVVLI